MPFNGILQQPQRMGGERDPRAEMAESVMGMAVPSLGVAQGVNEFLTGGGVVGLGMAAAGAIPGVPGNMDEIIEKGADIAKSIEGYSKFNKISTREGLMDYLDILAEDGEKIDDLLLQAIERALDITR